MTTIPQNKRNNNFAVQEKLNFIYLVSVPTSINIINFLLLQLCIQVKEI